MPRVGTQANSLAQLPEFKRELVQRELPAVADAGVDDARDDLSRLPPRALRRRRRAQLRGRQFHGAARRRARPRAARISYKRLKLIRDVDDIIVETAPLIAAHGLDLDTVRDALIFEFGQK